MRILTPLILPVLFVALTAMTWAGAAPIGQLDHEDDLQWVGFNDAKVVADAQRGVYTATFSTTLAKMNNVALSISGYMLPIEATTHSAHFIITRRLTGCQFCPPNEPTEAIEVFANSPVDYRQTIVTVAGRLKLVRESSQGLFYRLEGAKVE
ncbi:DUF3299 domain-containing protein (plasmid) [Polymorphobacter sp. PAMC 29334]|uniref:DUF3299 domain-containing protein n=1 Tax=Polymorphobacter sp. PAMC 29334 TaxID=2862331 RepID=UPI001C792DD2|nr:DUF3299 domain-containing protein [Polymorphobacter sp. PAMC 29334]QYE37273.1 DUF3299 domain-containing protein [Polymorphobacter sp. PAMC 29334]